MDRHIYRGRRVDNGEWVYGDLRHYANNEVGIAFLNKYEFGLTEYYEVIPETVGQYIGNTDMHCKDIYEDDIAIVEWFDGNDEYLEEVRGVVFYNKTDSCYAIKEADGYIANLTNDYAKFMRITIIGNKWDNPELLQAV